MVSRPLAFVGALLLLIAGTTGLALAQSDAQTTADNDTVSVTASAQVDRAPDRAVVTVVAVGRGDTAQAARNGLNDTGAIRRALENGSADVTTASFRIEPEFERTESGRERVGYVALQTFEAETENVSAVGPLVDAAVDAGADRVEGIRYELSEKTRQNARGEALTTAVDRARADAATLAAAEGRDIGSATSMRTGDSGPFFARAEAADAGGGGGTTIEPGPVTVEATVDITYRLE